MKYKKIFYYLVFCISFTACKKGVKQQDDSIYSRHLQKHMALTILNTTLPDNKEELNLLLLNGKNDLEQLNVKEIFDSLYKKKLIQPLIIVAVEADETNYGLTDLGNETAISRYNQFVREELYPYIKKKTVIRKFKSICVAGCSRGGVSAFDIAWNNADKIGKAGIFSGDFDYAGNTDTLNNALNFIKASRKRPHLQLWIYAGGNDNGQILNNSLSLENILESKSSISSDDITLIADKNGKNDKTAWRNQFANFLLWAFAK